MQKTEQLMLELVRLTLSGESFDRISADSRQADEIMAFARRHSMSYIVSGALKQLGFDYAEDRIFPVTVAERQTHALDLFCSALENAGVDYIVLKGPVIRDYYPDPYMRASSDIDILVKEKDIDAAAAAVDGIMHYKSRDKRFHDIKFVYGAGLALELHFSLSENNGDADSVLDTVWQYALPCPGTDHRYTMTNEFFMFYLTAHMAYHFTQGGGCGVRSFMDIYILNRKFKYDVSKTKELCKSCGLLTFFETVCETAEVWFGGSTHTRATSAVEKFILAGGTYGSFDNKIAICGTASGGKAKYILMQLLPPLESMQYAYPALKKAPVLLPFYWVMRAFRLAFSQKGKRGMKEIGKMTELDKQKQSDTADLFSMLELKR